MGTEENNIEEKIPIELTELRAMVYLPENSIEVEINAIIYDNGELVKVGETLRLSEIQSAFRDAEMNYISDDDKFVVTEKGLEWLNVLEKERTKEEM